jgi:hypothetical protein
LFFFHATRRAAILRPEQTSCEFLRLGRTVYFRSPPQALDELASGAIHLTGLFLLSGHLTEDNADRLIAEARGKSKRQLEELLARWAPRSDVPATITPSGPEPARAELSTMSGTGGSELSAPPPSAHRPRVEPLSATSFRVEFTASATLRDKLEHARNLLSHAVPSGDLATLIERAIDQLIAVETKRRAGAGQPRKRRETRAGSRHVPVKIDSPAEPEEFVGWCAQSRAPS